MDNEHNEGVTGGMQPNQGNGVTPPPVQSVPPTVSPATSTTVPPVVPPQTPVSSPLPEEKSATEHSITFDSPNPNEWPNVTVKEEAPVVPKEEAKPNPSPSSVNLDAVKTLLQEEKMQPVMEKPAQKPIQTIPPVETKVAETVPPQTVQETQKPPVVETQKVVTPETVIPKVEVPQQTPPVVSQPTPQPAPQTTVQPVEQAPQGETPSPLTSTPTSTSHTGLFTGIVLVVIIALLGGAFALYTMGLVPQSVLSVVGLQAKEQVVVPIVATTTQVAIATTTTETATTTENIATTTEEIKYDTVNGIKVPFMATGTDAATIDSNTNGVADILERKIAEKSLNQNGFDTAILISKVLQEAIVKKTFTKKEALDVIWKTTCLEANRTPADRKALSYIGITKLVADTPASQDILLNMLTVAGDYQAKDLPLCPVGTGM